MPDRLQELIQQRRLIEEHLAWLDREIAAAAPRLARSTASHSSVHPATTLAIPPGSRPAGLGAQDPMEGPSPLSEADTILAEYQQNPQNLERSVKRGCLLYFSGAMFILMLGVFLLYLYRVNRPLPAPPPRSTPAVEAE